VTDALGLPVDFILTGGERHDSTPAAGLLAQRETDFVIADKGYDFEPVRELIEAQGAIPVIPERRNRKHPKWWDGTLFKERAGVECLINKLKQYRRVFARYDKLAARYLAFVYFVATLIWLR
jgi:transposase